MQKILKNCRSDIASLARWLKVIAVLKISTVCWYVALHAVRGVWWPQCMQFAWKGQIFLIDTLKIAPGYFYSIFKCSCFHENNQELEFSLQLWRKLMQGWFEGKAHSWNLGRSHKYFGEINQNILMNSIKTFTYPIVKINEAVAKKKLCYYYFTNPKWGCLA